MHRFRRGFTTAEIITSIVIIGILGIAMTKLVVGQARSFQLDNGLKRARSAWRSAMNIMITALRMAHDSGASVTCLDATNNRRVDVRVPLVFGVVCEVNGGNAVLSLVPVDSFQMAAAKYGGYATRNASTGNYSFATAGSSDTIQSTGAGHCHSGGVARYADTVTSSGRAGSVMQVSPAPPAGTQVGDMAFVFQTVTYEFKTSAIYPGTLGLYRTTRGRSNTDTLAEEIIAPFASTARFNYYTNPAQAKDTSLKVAPTAANYWKVRGFQIVLPGIAPDTVPGRTAPLSTTTTTAVFFKNTRRP